MPVGVQIPFLRREFAEVKKRFFKLLLHYSDLRTEYEWLHLDYARDAILYLDADMSRRIVSVMIKNGADINAEIPDLDSGWQQPAPTRLIDSAARTGNLGLLRELHEKGARYSNYTFLHAVEGGNRDVIHHLVREQAIFKQAHEFSSAMLETLDEGGAEVLNMLQEHSVTARVYENEIYCAKVYAAAQTGDIAQLNILLESSTLAHMRLDSHLAENSSKMLGIALDKAMSSGEEVVAEMILKAGVDPNIYYRPCTDTLPNVGPLVHALKARNTPLIIALLEANANPNFPQASSTRKSPLMLAAVWGNQHIVQCLINSGAEPNSDSYGNDHPFKGSYPYSRNEDSLSIAAMNGNVAVARILLQAGANVNATFANDSKTALSIAVTNHDMAMVRLLLGFGADPSHHAPLVAASGQGDGFLEALVSACERSFSDCKKELGGLAVQQLVQRGEANKVKLLLDLLGSRVDLNRLQPCKGLGDYAGRCPDYQTPLGTAIRAEPMLRYDLTKMLLEYGADPNSTVTSWSSYSDEVRGRFTALLTAIQLNDAAMVNLLIAKGADPNRPARGKVKRTPLQFAAMEGKLEIVELLSSYQTWANDVPAYSGGATALQFAAIGGCVAIAELLLERGADVNAPKAKVNGRTAMEGAIEWGNFGMVKLLLAHGAVLDPKDLRNKCSEIRLAKDNGRFAIAKLLQSTLDRRSWAKDGKRCETDGGALRARENSGPCIMEAPVFCAPDGPMKTRTRKLASKPFCRACQQDFASFSSLKRHKGTRHSNEAKFRCPIKDCPERFKRKDMLNRHIGTKHNNDWKYRCPCCHRFFRSDYLKKHYPCKKT